MNCTVCNRNMTTAKGVSIIGVVIQLHSIYEDGEKNIREIYPELPPDLEVNVCYACWLKSLGVPLENRT